MSRKDMRQKGAEIQNIASIQISSPLRKTISGRKDFISLGDRGMAVSKVGKRFTVVVPQEVREKIPLRVGEAIAWRVEGERIIIRPTSFRRLAGIVEKKSRLKPEDVSKALEKEIEKDVQEAMET